ncbi:hypothetical protein GCM10023082_54620 [Streptomyces tremellae]|uniref:Uncharacterized protein n=1 Tax=Streptomyces tremellae TaxID=1124239 RepID=A0ABP7G0H5_9ACTN
MATTRPASGFAAPADGVPEGVGDVCAGEAGAGAPVPAARTVPPGPWQPVSAQAAAAARTAARTEERRPPRAPGRAARGRAEGCWGTGSFAWCGTRAMVVARTAAVRCPVRYGAVRAANA